MTKINLSNKICTLINVFTVAPEKQNELFENLKAASQKVMNKMPGFISANIHMGDDGKTVTNYAQWNSIEEYQNIFADPQIAEHMKNAAALAVEFKPVIYHEIWSEAASG